MLFHVKMVVKLPPDLPAETAQRLIADEKAMAQRLQQEGVWRHLWRIAGQYANFSVFDVESPAQLNELLFQLPLFRFMEIEVDALCRHPSSIHEDER
ncbi:muconolactone Delta-isomerase [Trinickia terrae]|uniref:Muconolactone Delta-isomerase n=1 Tax=Trinickia terrae TaxID=2571161 RepID=A0A4U1HWB1_9BURK|nr:muconolactone Delta-isomerase [Trinickia terrae]TKC85912.1 muconolactone Delta-isomerase [Trinickia terrae]